MNNAALDFSSKTVVREASNDFINEYHLRTDRCQKIRYKFGALIGSEGKR